MIMLASQITSLMVVYSIVYSGVNQRIHQSSASQAFVREIHRGPVNFPHKWPVTRKMFPFDDVIMKWVQIGTHRKYPIPHPSRQAIGCLLLGFGENWPRYIGTALCMNSSSPHLLGIHKSIWFFNDILTVPTHVYLGGKLGYAKISSSYRIFDFIASSLRWRHGVWN